MPNAVLVQTWQQGGETLRNEIAVGATGNGQGSFEIDLALTASQADVQIALAFDKDLLKGFFVESNLDLVIETNSTSEPDDTIPVVAGEGYAWASSLDIANPFTADPTTAYVTSQTAAAGNVKIRGIVDATP